MDFKNKKSTFNQRIDEETFSMAQGSNLVWVPWFMLMGDYGNLFLWSKSVEAIACRPVAELKNNPVALAYDTPVYEISAACPHCQKEFAYREFIGREHFKPNLPSIFTLAGVQARLAKFKRSSWFIRLFFFSTFLVSILFPMYRLLAWLRDPANRLAPAILTGCPHCSKRVRIYLSGI